jgi:hypothetical protein
VGSKPSAFWDLYGWACWKMFAIGIFFLIFPAKHQGACWNVWNSSYPSPSGDGLPICGDVEDCLLLGLPYAIWMIPTEGEVNYWAFCVEIRPMTNGELVGATSSEFPKHMIVLKFMKKRAHLAPAQQGSDWYRQKWFRMINPFKDKICMVSDPPINGPVWISSKSWPCYVNLGSVVE